MDSITFDIQGIDKLLQKFNKFDAKVRNELKDEVNASALKIQSDAKKNAPINFGSLRNSIYLKETGDNKKFVYTIGTNVKYAPYVEFGTGGKVSIPNGYQDYASQFKGRTSGKFSEMVLALTDWVIKKGIAGSGNKPKSVAYAIAISILRKGLRPQPFLIPAFESEKPKLKSKIKEILTNA